MITFIIWLICVIGFLFFLIALIGKTINLIREFLNIIKLERGNK